MKGGLTWFGLKEGGNEWFGFGVCILQFAILV